MRLILVRVRISASHSVSYSALARSSCEAVMNAIDTFGDFISITVRAA